MIRFPKDFFWGAATSAYQVEGGNSNSDWWQWEKKHGLPSSGAACRHYDLFSQDFDLVQRLHQNAHRLSIEWARVEPVEGKFSGLELEHYQQVIASLLERGITPIVTLHHFTNPAWFAALGSWRSRASVKYFSRYAAKVVEAFAGKVSFWVTINEPLVYVYHSFFIGAWPPQERSFLKSAAVTGNLARAHINAYRIIHDIYRKKNLPAPSVSIAQNVQAFEPSGMTLRCRLAALMRDYWFNFAFLNRLMREKSLDFIGINYYTRGLAEPKSWGPRSMLTDNCPRSSLKKNSLGWDIYPQGLRELLLKLKRYNLPVFILENGICTGDDALRWEFIREHLINLNAAMRQGVKVLGYIYWSLLDNFEWDKGFAPRFGLIEMDYYNYKRTIRDSALKFSQVCATGVLEDEAIG